MIDTCQEYYRDNEKKLEQIEKFKTSYANQECIRWYTRETFVYNMMNKTLRTEDVQQLHIFRFYINDLSSALMWENKNKQREETDLSTVYRSVRLTMNELEQLQSNEGKLISINGYLFASRLRQIAVSFAVENEERMGSIPVLFEIQCPDEEDNCSIFADIVKFSDFPDEQEVLFDLAAVFKVEKICQGEDIWTVYLIATDEGREIVREYIEETNERTFPTVRSLF